MRYWDSSAVVSLLIKESSTSVLRALREEDPDQTVWCLTPVEIASALARRAREGLPADQEKAVRAAWSVLSDRWEEVSAMELVRSRAMRLLNTHPIRAADALQLAACLIVCEERPESLPFVSLDDRLRDAARREGFSVLPL
jgi:predicted nucleic acid-binding protein